MSIYRRIAGWIVLGALVMSVALPTARVLAATEPCTNGSLDEKGVCVPDSADPSTKTTTADSSSKIPTALKTPTGPSDGLFASVMNELMQVFAWLLGVAAITLDTTVYYTVVTMGDVVKNLAAVGVTWRILRDFGNIMIIFGFLAIGISIILDTERMGYGKKMLPILLLASVTVNFSLFAAEAVIDVGNLFATQFYTQINGGNPAGAKITGFDAVGREGISNKIMGQLGLQTLYGDTINQPQLFLANNSVLVGVLGSILFLVAAFVFFSLAFILIFRFVALVLLIVVAPVGFAGLAVPKLDKVAHMWWEQLFEQTLTAPILMLGLYVALAVITDAQFLTGFGTGAQAWTAFVKQDPKGLVNFAGTLLSFVVAMALLLGVTVLAKKMGAYGASTATKWGGMASFGITAMAGRSTLGWGSTAFARQLRKSSFARVPLLGTGVVKGLERVGAASFDVRSTGALKQMPLGGVDAGDARKGGYKADLKARTDARVKYASDLKGDLSAAEKETLAKTKLSLQSLQKKADRAVGTADEATTQRALKEAKDLISALDLRTDAGAQRKYANTLRLGLGEDSRFNWLNLAANTDAAGKIIKASGKSESDKQLEDIAKALAKSAASS